MVSCQLFCFSHAELTIFIFAFKCLNFPTNVEIIDKTTLVYLVESITNILAGIEERNTKILKQSLGSLILVFIAICCHIVEEYLIINKYYWQ